MLAYHFRPAANCLDDLANQHIKLSEIDKLNDPFELWCSAQGDDGIRAALRARKKEMGRRYGYCVLVNAGTTLSCGVTTPTDTEECRSQPKRASQHVFATTSVKNSPGIPERP
jgi:hypothetical protein